MAALRALLNFTTKVTKGFTEVLGGMSPFPSVKPSPSSVVNIRKREARY